MSKRSALREKRRQARAARRRRQQIFGLSVAGLVILVIAFVAIRQVTINRQEQRAAAETQTVVEATLTVIAATDTALAKTPPTPSPTPLPLPTDDPNLETVTTASGLQYQDIVVGSGAEAQDGNTVVVDYSGWLTDGKLFDSSHNRGEPFSFTLGTGNVIKGWDEGVKGMKIGGTRKLIIPPDLGYGESGQGSIPPSATLIFIIDLLEIQ